MSQQAVSRGPIGGSIPSLTKVVGVFTAAGGADMALVMSGGIVSVAYAGSAGLFTVTFSEQPGKLLGANIVANTVAAGAPFQCKVNLASLSQSAKTVNIEFWGATGAAVASPTSGATVYLEFTFAQSSI